MESKDERIAAACANAVLDRLYGKPTQVTEAKVETTSIQAAHLKALNDIRERRLATLAADTDATATAETVVATIIEPGDDN